MCGDTVDHEGGKRRFFCSAILAADPDARFRNSTRPGAVRLEKSIRIHLLKSTLKPMDKETDVKKLIGSMGLGLLGLFMAGIADAGDELKDQEHGVKKSVPVRQPDGQTRLAILKIIRDAGSRSHKVRVEAYQKWFDRRWVNVYLPLVSGLSFSSGRSRSFSAWALGELCAPDAIEPLSRRALFDEDPAVRRMAADSIKKIGAKMKGRRSLQPFIKALKSKFLGTRIRAATAMGYLGDRRAIPHLVETIEYFGGPGPRVNLFAGRQRAYIRGYGAEVARGAGIARPNVGIVQSGTVLDARVIRTQGRLRIYRKVVLQSLERLSGMSFGDDLRAWCDWHRKQKRKKPDRS